LRNKGNKYYQNTHGNVFKRKTNDKNRKKKILMKKNSKVIRAPSTPTNPV
jgi:hypothetical protein